MLYKLKQTFFIILGLIVINSCQTRWTADTFVKSRQNKSKQKKEQIKADKQKQKSKKEYKQSVERKRNKQYERQSTSTKEAWDRNAEQSKTWRKKEFHNKSFGYRVRKFFEKFEREPKPSEGLYSKKQMRKSKGNIFQRTFKKNKKNKRKR